MTLNQLYKSVQRCLEVKKKHEELDKRYLYLAEVALENNPQLSYKEISEWPKNVQQASEEWYESAKELDQLQRSLIQKLNLEE